MLRLEQYIGAVFGPYLIITCDRCSGLCMVIYTNGKKPTTCPRIDMLSQPQFRSIICEKDLDRIELAELLMNWRHHVKTGP